jgi:hypothetical protein
MITSRGESPLSRRKKKIVENISDFFIFHTKVELFFILYQRGIYHSETCRAGERRG